MKRLLASKTGEGYINTAVKIIIAVVVGALILGGIYLLFAGDNGVMGQMNQEVYDMMHYEEPALEIRIDVSKRFNTIEYTYDRNDWFVSELPDLGESAVVRQMVQEGGMVAAFVDNEEHTYLVSSIDGGITWNVRRTFHPDPSSTTLAWRPQPKVFYAEISYDNTTSMYTSADAVRWPMYGSPLVRF